MSAPERVSLVSKHVAFVDLWLVDIKLKYILYVTSNILYTGGS